VRCSSCLSLRLLPAKGRRRRGSTACVVRCSSCLSLRLLPAKGRRRRESTACVVRCSSCLSLRLLPVKGRRRRGSTACVVRYSSNYQPAVAGLTSAEGVLRWGHHPSWLPSLAGSLLLLLLPLLLLSLDEVGNGIHHSPTRRALSTRMPMSSCGFPGDTRLDPYCYCGVKLLPSRTTTAPAGTTPITTVPATTGTTTTPTTAAAGRTSARESVSMGSTTEPVCWYGSAVQ
jgi:hypothetical protein